MKPSELLSSPEKWGKGHYAKTIKGLVTTTGDKDAYCFCLVGSFIRCFPDVDAHEGVKVLVPAIEKRFPERLTRPTDVVVQFNDHPDTTYEEVISVLKEANL